LISANDRRKLKIVLPAYMSLSLLDLLGVVFLGSVATIGFSSITEDAKPSRLEIILRNLLPVDLSRSNLIILLTASAIFFLLMKTMLQALFDYKYTKYSARLEAEIASKLYDGILDGEISHINKNNFADYQYALLVGSNRVVVGIIAPSINFIADIFTTVLMFTFALYASPSATAIVFFVFFIAYLGFNGPIGNKAKSYGVRGADSYLKITNVVQESIRGIRELRVYGKENAYKDNFRLWKFEASIINQKVVWLNGLIKYLLEISILLSGSLVALFLFFTEDLRQTITITTVFLLMGFRLIPTIQRLQNSINSLKISTESTKSLFSLISDFPQPDTKHPRIVKFDPAHLSAIQFNNVSYEIDSSNKILDSISFELKVNETLAIVGESGAGKSTLVDLLVGSYKPTNGTVEFRNLKDPGSNTPQSFEISFISQSCALLGNNIYQNICLENKFSNEKKKKMDLIINNLQLTHLLGSDLDNERKIRSDSTNVSGGEKQRISIARATYFDRGIVVLDEPTSALDQDNEKRIIEYLLQIKQKKTVIVVSHSESLMHVVDKVLMLEKGRLVFFGPKLEFDLFSRRNSL
jgi:ABC-type multidrug transport system fused ATPase/permease subunit